MFRTPTYKKKPDVSLRKEFQWFIELSTDSEMLENKWYMQQYLQVRRIRHFQRALRMSRPACKSYFPRSFFIASPLLRS